MTDLAHALALAESAVEDCMPDGTPWRTLDPTVRAQAAIALALCDIALSLRERVNP